jgi:nitrous oxidase accessory protein NosD
VVATGAPIPGPPGEGWEPVTSTDFNGDGLSDVVWTDTERAVVAVWLLNGTQLLAAGPEIDGPAGEGWIVSGAGDTNGDGMADVAWNNSAENLFSIWLMDGAQVLARGPMITGPPHKDRLLSDLGDTNGDGLADIVWSDPDVYSMQVYLLNGAQLLARGPDVSEPPGEGWTAVTVVDFNGDGMSDVVWKNDRRSSMAAWLMNGAQLLAPGPEIPGPGEGWTLAHAVDVNGDGMADAAWQKEGTSLFSIWLMDGARVLAKGPVLPGPGEIARP